MSTIIQFPDLSIVDAADIKAVGISPAGGIYYYLGPETAIVSKMSPEDAAAKMEEIHEAMVEARAKPDPLAAAFMVGDKTLGEAIMVEAKRVTDEAWSTAWGWRLDGARNYTGETIADRLFEAIEKGLAGAAK